MREDVQRFGAVIEASGPIWHSIEIKTIGVQVQQVWHNLYTRVWLKPEQSSGVSVLQDAELLPNLRLQHSRLGIEYLPVLLADLEHGLLDTGERPYLCRELESGGVGAERSYMASSSYTLVTDQHPSPGGPWGGPLPPRWSAEGLLMHGSRMSQMISSAESERDEISNGLRSLDEPLDGVLGLLKWFLGTNASMDHGCTVEFIAPYEAELVPVLSEYRDGNVSIAVKVHSGTLLDKLKLGVTTQYAKGNAKPTSIRPSPEQWVQNDGVYSQRLSVPFVGAESVVVLLSAGPKCIYRLELEDQTDKDLPRQRIYRSLDPLLGELDERLFGSSSAGRSFEEAVARLFHLLGFSVDYLGGSKALSDAADVIAIADDHKLCLVVEVTSSSLDTKGKLGKLVARTASLRASVPDWHMVPTIVSKLEREWVSAADMATAANDTVTVLTIEDVRHLRDLVGRDGCLERSIRAVRE